MALESPDHRLSVGLIFPAYTSIPSSRKVDRRIHVIFVIADEIGEAIPGLVFALVFQTLVHPVLLIPRLIPAPFVRGQMSP